LQKEVQLRLEEKQALESKFNDLNRSFTQLSTNNAKLDDDNSKLKGDIEEKDRINAALKDSVKELTESRHQLEVAEKIAKADLDRLKAQISSANTDSSDLQTQLDAAKASLSAANVRQDPNLN